MRRKALGSSPLKRVAPDQGKVVGRYETAYRSEAPPRVRLSYIDGRVRLFTIEDDQVTWEKENWMKKFGSPLDFSSPGFLQFSSRDPLGHISVWVHLGAASKHFVYEDELNGQLFVRQLWRMLDEACREERMRRAIKTEERSAFPRMIFP